MTLPYAVNEPVAHLSVAENGMRVRLAFVEEIEDAPRQEGYRITTTEGTGLVGRDGVGKEILPLDDELRAMFKGDVIEFVLQPHRELRSFGAQRSVVSVGS
jgi:hypothetical protein